MNCNFIPLDLSSECKNQHPRISIKGTVYGIDEHDDSFFTLSLSQDGYHQVSISCELPQWLEIGMEVEIIGDTLFAIHQPPPTDKH